ncbi:MAG: peptidylprolyl isomerase [Gammaproteobacteria bacterium]|nr:peptidylprolyl isomerase [Gammaproteobacteria bacterium]
MINEDDQPLPQVRLYTSVGEFLIELYPDRAPVSVQNFLEYVKNGFYDNTLFHRVVDNFIVQCGGFEPGMIQKTTRAPIENESGNGLLNQRGTVAMARLPTDPDSATSQFFINTRDNSILDYFADTPDGRGYCVFGSVIEGMEVVERIEGAPTRTVGEHNDVPLKDIVLQRAQLL